MKKRIKEGTLKNFVGQIKAIIPDRQNKGATVRFDNGMPCCTCTYNYSMSVDDQRYLAKRIAAALNATQMYSLEELENLSFGLLRGEAFKGVGREINWSGPNSKPPSQENYYLTCSDGWGVDVTLFTKKEEGWGWNQRLLNENITHWAPLPLPPKGLPIRKKVLQAVINDVLLERSRDEKRVSISLKELVTVVGLDPHSKDAGAELREALTFLNKKQIPLNFKIKD